MQQRVYTVEVIELAELVTENALEVASAKGADLIFGPRSALHAGHQPLTLYG
jgi:hypothetical protein